MSEADRTTARWAPWWAYVGAIAAANVVPRWLFPFGTQPRSLDVVVALFVAAALFVLITLGYRLARRPLRR